MYIQAAKVAKLPTVRRLPSYLHELEKMQEVGLKDVSGTVLAGKLGLEPIQVRKDLAITGITGKPRVGFEVKPLIKAINKFLGWTNTKQAILVGVGQLGSALLAYEGFEHYGLKLIAAFDSNPNVIGQEKSGIEILDIKDLAGIIKRLHVNVGVVTVPGNKAQAITDALVDAGIRAIWNFAPITLSVPNSVAVQNEDLASGLAVLSLKLDRFLEIDDI